MTGQTNEHEFMGTGWTKAARTRFLAHLAETGNISEAARLVGLSRSRAYALRLSDAEFAIAWAEAEAEAADALEREARRRAVEGVEQPLVYAGKFVRLDDGSIATIRHYSDRLLEFLLRARRPDRFGSKSAITETETGDGETDPSPAALSDEERARRVARLLDAGRTRRAGPSAAD